jgi:uncharacterized protein YllA (UPF0747 family)
MNQNKMIHLNKNIDVSQTNEFTEISRMVWPLLLPQTRTDMILTNALGTRFSKRICNAVSCYLIGFIPHLFHRCSV